MISAMHMAVDLERIGGYGINIAWAVLGLGGERAIPLPPGIPKIKEVLLAMLDRLLPLTNSRLRCGGGDLYDG